MIACNLCSMWQPSFVKNDSACCPWLSVYVFFNRFISRIENKFKPPRSIRPRFPRGRIFPIILTLSPIFVITQRFVLSAIDLFVLTLAISFRTRAFCLLQGLFHIPNNPTMSPLWPKNIHLYSPQYSERVMHESYIKLISWVTLYCFSRRRYPLRKWL